MRAPSADICPARGFFVFPLFNTGDSQPTGWSINGRITERNRTMADTDTTGAEEQVDDAQSTGDATGAPKGGTTEQDVTFTPEQQKLIDQRIGEARRKAREQAAAELEAERKKAEADAEAKRLEEKQEFKELAEARANQIVDLQKQVDRIPELEAQLEASNKALTAQLETLREGVPAHILELISERDLPSQLDWLAKHRGEYVTTEAGRKGHVPATPKANANGIPDEERLKQSAQTWRGI